MEKGPLVRLLQNVNHKQLFFGVWAVIVGLSVWGMIAYYRRYTRSNFRSPGDRGPSYVPTDLRRLTPNEGRGKVAQGGTEKPKA